MKLKVLYLNVLSFLLGFKDGAGVHPICDWGLLTVTQSWTSVGDPGAETPGRNFLP